MQKPPYQVAQKLMILQAMESGQISIRAAAKIYGIGRTTLAEWQPRYEVYGYAGLETRTRNRRYSAEFKLQAVLDYLSGSLSQSQIIDKYQIVSRTQLRNWVKTYNDHSSIKIYSGGTKAMTKGRTTTWQERIDIVLYCLAQQHDYQKTADHFQVSYQQVYQWVKKYERGGEDALRDGRGGEKRNPKRPPKRNTTSSQ
ncbi:Transposase and inactivated derivatives [Paenibacillus sophorae]|uniref:Helix-turn-helix domain-containing protein n=1 Tax=Paenibacillus sophorae TaxID=1333845 RepID=A0A1H8ILM2_9BACL|nr:MULTISPECIES: helix-turn-helix domain-containing protein [Paenibacillus]QWU15994.1 helix-turn-helix domain-containing protein [Paenibacillus sophorae]SEN68926.1 Transposase and inactivated derivatives [Paenibacillus sophorae]